MMKDVLKFTKVTDGTAVVEVSTNTDYPEELKEIVYSGLSQLRDNSPDAYNLIMGAMVELFIEDFGEHKGW